MSIYYAEAVVISHIFSLEQFQLDCVVGTFFFTPFHISPLAPNLIDNIVGKVRLYPIADKPC